jgi:hypothetical protein
MTDTSTPAAGDLLYGARAIADFLGITPKATYHLVEAKRIPSFKIGKTICSRRSTLARAIEELEAEAGAE